MTTKGMMMEQQTGRDRTTIIALCFLLSIIEGFDIQAMGVAAPRMVPELKFTLAQMGWIFAIGNIGLVVGSLLGGRLADQWGRKRVLIASVITFALFTFAVVVTRSFDGLFAVRFLTGAGFGAVLPNLMAIGTEISTPERRARTATTMFCGMPLGGGSVALLTQILPQGTSWRLLFVIGGMIPLLVALALQWKMPETLRSARYRAAMPLREALFGGGRAVPTLLLWLTFLPTLTIMYLFLNWLPLLVAAKHLDRAVTPQASAAFNYASVVGALIFGRLVDRYGPRWPLLVCYVGVLVGLWLLADAAALSSIVWLSASAGFFMLGANFSLNGVAPAHYPAAGRGTGSGASTAAGRIGSVLGPLLAGMMLNAGASAATVINYMLPVGAVAAIACLSISFYPTSR